MKKSLVILILPGGAILLVLLWVFRQQAAQIAATALSPMIPNATRGIRNNNPGNLRYDGTQWQGLVGQDANGFCIFDTPENGFRAMGINALSFQLKNGINTLAEFGLRWAPPSDNDGASDYGLKLAAQLGVDQGAAFDLTQNTPFTLAALMRAISHNENGAILTDLAYNDALIGGAADLAQDYVEGNS